MKKRLLDPLHLRYIYSTSFYIRARELRLHEVLSERV